MISSCKIVNFEQDNFNIQSLEVDLFDTMTHDAASSVAM